MRRFHIIIIPVAPKPRSGGTVPDACVRIAVKQPERNVNPFDLLNPVFVLEELRQQALSLKMAPERRFRSIFVQLEGNHPIRPQRAGKLALHNDGISAVWAACRRGASISYDLAPARCARIRHDLALLRFAPPGAAGLLPLRFLFGNAAGLLVIFAQGFRIKRIFTIRAFHFLRRAVEYDLAIAARAFVPHRFRHSGKPPIPLL